MGVVSPGPSFILVAQTAMARSRVDAIAVSFGMGIGAMILAIIASIGLFVLLETVPWVYAGLKLVGGVYLCFLAYRMWHHSNDPMQNHVSSPRASSGMVKLFFVGLLTQLSNPKIAVVFGSVFAAFLPSEMPAYSYYLLCFCAFFIDSFWYVLVSTLLSTRKAQSTYARFKKSISRAASGLMGLMGVKLLTDY